MKKVSLAQRQARNRCLVNAERKEGGLCHSGVWNLPITPKIKSWGLLTLVHEALHVLPPNHSSIVLPPFTPSFSSVSTLSMVSVSGFMYVITSANNNLLSAVQTAPTCPFPQVSDQVSPQRCLPCTSCLGESTHNPYSVTIYFLYFWFFCIAHIAAWYCILCLFVNILSSPLCYKLSHWG